MGNQVGHGSLQRHPHARQARIFNEEKVEKEQRRGISHELGGKKSAKKEHKCNVSITTDKTQHSNTKHKKYLSLTKQSFVGEVGTRAESKEKKGIRLTSPNQMKHTGSMANIINYQDYNSKRDSIKGRPMSVRPRDLPRHSSHKKIPTYDKMPLNTIRTMPSGPSHKVIRVQQNQERNPSNCFGEEPTIQIKYATVVVDPWKKEQNKVKNSTYQSTAAPSTPYTSAQKWFTQELPVEESSRKLKRVPLTKSFELNSAPKPVTHEFQQQSVFVKQISDMSILKNNFKDETKHFISKFESSRSNYIDCKQNEFLFTDPKLMNYIKDDNKEKMMKKSKYFNDQLRNSNLNRFKEVESKYAVAYPENGQYLDNLMDNKILSESYTKESPVANKYSVAFDKWPASSASSQRLEEKVQRQVESKQIIQEPFRFPTATDFSYEERSNPSFIPLKQANLKDRINFIQLDDEDQDILQYCKPKINSKVMADMLKLPLKV